LYDIVAGRKGRHTYIEYPWVINAREEVVKTNNDANVLLIHKFSAERDLPCLRSSELPLLTFSRFGNNQFAGVLSRDVQRLSRNVQRLSPVRPSNVFRSTVLTRHTSAARPQPDDNKKYSAQASFGNRHSFCDLNTENFVQYPRAHPRTHNYLINTFRTKHVPGSIPFLSIVDLITKTNASHPVSKRRVPRNLAAKNQRLSRGQCAKHTSVHSSYYAEPEP